MNDIIRVVHVAGSAQWAGGEVFLQQMSEHLDRNRFEMSVVCPEEGPLRSELENRGIRSEVVSLSPLGSPIPVLQLRKVFKELKADIVQSHGARSNFYARLAAASLPHISTIHNSLDDYPVSMVKRVLYKTMDNLTAAKSSCLAFVADALRQDYLKRVPRLAEKMRVLHNGVDTQKFNPAKYDSEKIRARMNLKPVWTMGIIGRMTQQKGHIYLWEALRRSLSVLPSFQLLVVGDGPLRLLLEAKTTEYGLRSHCQFLGVRSDIAEILAALDVLVMPSVSEGFPYVLLEALAMKKIVVASDVNGVSEIMSTENEGYKIPARQPEKIEDALLQILRDPGGAAKRAENGYLRVKNHFDVKITIKRWEKLYTELMDKKGSR